TASIPIVIAGVADPVAEGFAVSLAEPGRNVTGLSTNLDVMPKQVDLLKTVLPKLARVAVLRNPGNAGNDLMLKQVQATAQAKRINVLPLEGRAPADIEQAFAVMAKERPDALIVLADTSFLQQAQRLVELSIKQKIPTIYGSEHYVRLGGFM